MACYHTVEAGGRRLMVIYSRHGELSLKTKDGAPSRGSTLELWWPLSFLDALTEVKEKRGGVSRWLIPEQYMPAVSRVFELRGTYLEERDRAACEQWAKASMDKE